MSTNYMAQKRKSTKSNSEPSSNGSSPPASVNLTNGNNMNQVANNNNLNAANNNNNAPKYGTLVPNRVFVGGISSTTTETELCQLFSKYGNVKATKIIADRAGVSKGYGFVTFETDEEAKRLQLDADNIILKERRLNIAPAIIKQGLQVRNNPVNRRKNTKIIISIQETNENGEQAFPPRGFEATTSPPPMLPNVYMCNGIPYTYQNGTAFFQPPQLQAAPMQAAPDASIYPGYGPAQGPTQTYAPTMMYANPAPMYLPPQYQQYQPMPMSNQPHQLMYTQSIQTLNNGADTPSPIPLSPHGTPPFFVSQGEMRPEMYYLPPSAGQAYSPYSTPMMLTTVPDPSVQYCEIASDQPGTNVPNEVVAQPPIPEEGAPARQQTDAHAPNADAANQEQSSHLQSNTETPIVSLRNLQKIDESDNTVRYYRHGGGHGRSSDAQKNVHTDFNERGGWRRNRGGRGNAVSSIPKFPYQTNNNNPSVTNNNNYKTGDYGGRGGYRGNGGSRGSYRTNQQNGGRRIITRSTTPPNANDPIHSSYPHPNLNNYTNHLQMNQQQTFMAGRNMQQPYHGVSAHNHTAVVTAGGGNAMHQQMHAHAHYNSVNAHHPAPLPQQSNVPPRRFNNMTANSRRMNQNNNNHHSSRKKVEIDNGAAGDAPVPNHETPPSTAKGSPPPTVTSTEQELLCSGVNNLSVQ